MNLILNRSSEKVVYICLDCLHSNVKTKLIFYLMNFTCMVEVYVLIIDIFYALKELIYSIKIFNLLIVETLYNFGISTE